MRAVNINIILNPNDGSSRIAVQLIDGELDKVNALNGPGVIFAQVFPQIGSNGKVLGINLKAFTLDHTAGQRIKEILKDARNK